MASEITLEWLEGIKRSWKKLIRDIQKADVGERVRPLEKAVRFVNVLQEDLLLNKGFWFVFHAYDERGARSLREKVVDELKNLKEAISDAEFPASLLQKGFGDREKSIEMMEEALDNADSIFSRKLVPTLKRELKKVDKIDLGGHLPNKVKLKGVTVVFDEKAQHNPTHVMNLLRDTRHPEQRENYLKYFDKARALLERKGFGHLWYGPIVVELQASSAAGGGMVGGTAKYEPSLDRVTYYAVPDSYTTYALIHELGHRHWYKFMSPRDRQYFSAYFETGEVDPVTEYGGTMSEEDFAEVFAHYVTGKSMGRDQLERFKSFFGREMKSSVGDIATKVAHQYLTKMRGQP